jgi:outer membrane protein OmpA-like peptidoglycan-associated protein/Mg-chelatase subunit ChlD
MKLIKKRYSLKFLILYFFCCAFTHNDLNANDLPIDSLKTAKEVLQEAQVTSQQKQIKITIQNVDITSFPIIKIIVEAYNIYGEPLDTIPPETLTVMENGVEKKVISVEKISIKERVPVDFVFVMDKTGSMQSFIDQTKKNIYRFANSLQSRGIDYRIGLVLFSDNVERVYQPTNDLTRFLSWLDATKAEGGGDFKENSLEALAAAARMEFRPAANRVAILITDAPYHQQGEKGEGICQYTTSSIVKYLNDKELRVFSIVPQKLETYSAISKETRGCAFDIDFPFSTVLDRFSMQLTNLFAIRYRTAEPAIPDSIRIALLNEKKQELVRKIIPIIELGRKLIIENLLYKTNSAELSDSVPELEVLTEFLSNKKNVVILVEGHTDAIGSNKLNDALSLQRAESVKRYLVQNGIPAYRIKTKGYGKRRPIADNSTEFGRQLNRRTEIVIVSK